MEFVALDLETTGLSPQKNYILEIGALKVVDEEIIDTFETFLQCPVAIEPRIVELTGITDEMVRDGMTEKEAVSKLLEFVGGRDILGHNIPFDYSFLMEAARRQGTVFEAKLLDTLKIARKVLPEVEKKSLEYLCSYYHIHTKESHRALEDARAAYELYKILYQEFGQQKELFEPFTVVEKERKKEPMTKAQKGYLTDLLKFHHLTLEQPMELMSKSQASRKIDEIIREHGRIVRFR